MEQDLSIMQAVDALVQRIDQELHRLSVDVRLGQTTLRYLMQIRGFRVDHDYGRLRGNWRDHPLCFGQKARGLQRVRSQCLCL